MTNYAGEFGGEKVSTDELLQERMALHLGSEAARAFFGELYQRPLDDRVLMMRDAVRLLAWLDRSSEPQDTGDLSEIVITPGAEVPETTGRFEGVVDTLNGYTGAMEPDPVATSPMPIEETEYEGADENIPIDDRIRTALSQVFDNETLDALALTIETSDRDAVIELLTDLRGPIKSKIDWAVFIEMLYDGNSTDEAAALAGLNETSALTSWGKYMKQVQENAASRDDDLVALLQSYRRSGEATSTTELAATTIDSEHEEVQSPAESLEVSEDDSAPEAEAAEIVEMPSDEAHADYYEQLDAAINRLCGDDAKVESIQALLTEEQFDVGRMSVGRDILAELVARYADNRGTARANLGEIDDAAYRIIRDLAGSGTRTTNHLPRTLPVFLQFNRSASEDQVIEHLVRLLSKAADKGYEAPVPAPTKPSPVAMAVVAPSVMPPSIERLETRAPLIVDLFLVAKGEVKTSRSDWNAAKDELFASLKEKGILKGFQVTLLEERLNERGGAVLDDETRAILGDLYARSRQPGSRINEDLAVADIFDMFTNTASGAKTVDYIAEKLTGDHKRKISETKVRYSIVGGIAAVTESDNDQKTA